VGIGNDRGGGDEVPCPNCGEFIDAKSVFCGHCGERLSEPEKLQPCMQEEYPLECPNCGEKYDPRSAFCLSCGKRVMDESKVVTLDMEPAEVAVSFVELVSSSQLERAEHLWCERDGFVNFLNDFAGTGFVEYRIHSSEISEDEATCIVKGTLIEEYEGQEFSEDLELTLSRYSGAWMISRCSSK
jgi:hypothetical protein